MKINQLVGFIRRRQRCQFIRGFDRRFSTIPYNVAKPLPEINIGFERN